MSDKQERGNCWSLTINNPTQTDEYNIQTARQRGWKVEGQKEKGDEGTEHYQLIVKTPQVRFSAVKKQFPRAHIEKARNAAALEKYVKKEDSRIGQLPETLDKYPSLAKLWDMLYDYHVKHYCGGSHDPLDFITIPNDEKRLEMFDNFIADSIRKGYHVETMGVNPQVRSCVKNYFNAMMVRSRNIRRQTDRQTDNILVSSKSITHGSNEEEDNDEAQSSASPSPKDS